jgi:hypothetical protein
MELVTLDGVDREGGAIAAVTLVIATLIIMGM